MQIKGTEVINLALHETAIEVCLPYMHAGAAAMSLNFFDMPSLSLHFFDIPS